MPHSPYGSIGYSVVSTVFLQCRISQALHSFLLVVKTLQTFASVLKLLTWRKASTAVYFDFLKYDICLKLFEYIYLKIFASRDSFSISSFITISQHSNITSQYCISDKNSCGDCLVRELPNHLYDSTDLL